MIERKNLEFYNLLSPSVLKFLKYINISSREDLIKEGIINVFAKLKQNIQGLTCSVLWRLYAIEQDIKLNQITQETKLKLNAILKHHSILRNFPDYLTMHAFMEKALFEAKKAYQQNEVPVGAIIVADGEIIGRGYNRCVSENFIGHHAEILAIKEASAAIKNYRLTDCDLYVTVEPCMMCTGAIIQARIPRVIYGTPAKKTGMIESFDADSYHYMNHHTAFQGGILKEKCQGLLSDFFKTKRK